MVYKKNQKSKLLWLCITIMKSLISIKVKFVGPPSLFLDIGSEKKNYIQLGHAIS